MAHDPPAGPLFVLGLDAATFTVIDALLQRGELPHFRQAIDQGIRATLASTIPPVTPPAWTSMATGVNPGKHGVFDFFLKEAGSYELRPNNAATIAANETNRFIDSPRTSATPTELEAALVRIALIRLPATVVLVRLPMTTADVRVALVPAVLIIGFTFLHIWKRKHV